ncbi:MAG TPA: pyridoxamine 5'-phosphate oxidase family protein [Chitinophagaceae bacterium]|nr:pyridoxamine 5'-phosphate oxidase family protein [Chitinophagaceae bacterium]
MQVNQQLNFLQEKIHEIGSAIFFNLSDSILKLPTSIVNTLRVDEYGFVWFYIQKPKQDLREFDQEFPVRLDFFRKGTQYFLQVMGKARIVNDPEEMNLLEETLPDELRKATENMVLVKVKMQKAEYHDTSSTVSRTSKTSWWQSAVSTVYTWFRSSNGGYRPEVFYPASLN